MIYDCFPFLNELDILEIRLEELSPVVDRFVLVEATRTFKGGPKPLYFDQHKERFQKWLPQIVHIVVEDMPDGVAWDRDWFQKEAIKRGLPELTEVDWVVISDVDEIPNPRVFNFPYPVDERWAACPPLLTLHQRAYYYHFNYRYRWDWFYPKLVRGDYLNPRSVCECRMAQPYHNGIIPDAGWHFTYQGGLDQIHYKVRSFAHWDEPTAEPMLKRFRECGPLRAERDHLTRVEIDQSFPKAIYEHQQKWIDRGFIKV